MNEKVLTVADGNTDSVLGYNPLFSINGDIEDALLVLRGVSGALSMLSIGASESTCHKSTSAVLEMLSGVTDAALQTIGNETARV